MAAECGSRCGGPFGTFLVHYSWMPGPEESREAESSGRIGSAASPRDLSGRGGGGSSQSDVRERGIIDCGRKQLRVCIVNVIQNCALWAFAGAMSLA
jgi:hypothetical protein